MAMEQKRGPFIKPGWPGNQAMPGGLWPVGTKAGSGKVYYQAAHYHGAEESPYKTGLWPAAGRGTKAGKFEVARGST